MLERSVGSRRGEVSQKSIDPIGNLDSSHSIRNAVIGVIAANTGEPVPGENPESTTSMSMLR